MIMATAILCCVCHREPEDPIDCQCGAVHCRYCIDGHECPAPQEIILRDYQEDDIAGLRRMIREGRRVILLVQPTGAGKRKEFAWLTKQASDRGKRVLFVVNRRTLTTQFSDELRSIGVPHNITMGTDTTPDKGELVVVASIQTLRRRHFFHPDTGKTDGTGLPSADLVLADEAHLDLRSYKKLMEFYPGAVIIGNTATPVGPGGKGLADVWPAMYVGATKSELIERGCLVPTRMYSPSEPDMEGVKITRKNADEVEKRTRQCTVFANVFKQWQPWSDLPTVVFVPGVEFARWIAGEFKARGYSAVCVDAKTPKKERKRIFDGVADGSIRVVVSVDVLKVGVDCPRWKCAIDMQVTNHLRDFIQKAGRICRACGDATEAVYLDFSGAWYKHGHPDEDVAWDELKGDETTADLVANARNKPGAPQPIRCPKCTHVRKYGDKCPNCGFEYAKLTRLVQMGDGRLVKKQPTKRKEKKAPTSRGTPEWQVQKWRGAIYRAARGKREQTLRQARKLYQLDTGQWPSYDMPCNFMPKPDSADWDRKAGDVFEWARKKDPKA